MAQNVSQPALQAISVDGNAGWLKWWLGLGCLPASHYNNWQCWLAGQKISPTSQHCWNSSGWMAGVGLDFCILGPTNIPSSQLLFQTIPSPLQPASHFSQPATHVRLANSSPTPVVTTGWLAFWLEWLAGWLAGMAAGPKIPAS